LIDATTADHCVCPGEIPIERERLDDLVSSSGCLIGKVTRISSDTDGISVYASAVGNLEHVQPNIRSTMGPVTGVELSGSGGGTNPRLARAVSIARATR
jgi:ribosomal protein S12 methylthiotransferase accessory factor